MDVIQAVDLDDGRVEETSRLLGDPPWLSTLRTHAYNTYGKMAWPTVEEEEWRRTDLSGVDFGRYRLNIDQTQSTPPVVKSDSPPGVAFFGTQVIQRNTPEILESNGGKLVPFALGGERADWRDFWGDKDIGKLFGHGAFGIDNKILAWHFSLWTVGVILYVPDGMYLDEPIVVDYSADEQAGYIAPHTIIVLGKRARANVIQKFGSNAGADLMWNAGLQVALGDGAELSLASIQNVGTSDTFLQHNHITIAENSHVEYFEGLTGGELCKTRTEVHLSGAGSEAELSGIYIADKDQHMDVRTVQYHESHHTQSRAFYKGAVKDSGRTVYQGLIDVDSAAVSTDAYLTNKNLILHDEMTRGKTGHGRADSIPSLRIRTNDVKCSHGSTTGKIDDEQLFYLMARGISREEARKELAVGYFEEVIRNASSVIRGELQSLVEARIAGNGAGEGA